MSFPIVFFFFTSRRRHTRCLSDWSSDVCSSDLSRFSRWVPLNRGRIVPAPECRGAGRGKASPSRFHLCTPKIRPFASAPGPGRGSLSNTREIFAIYWHDNTRQGMSPAPGWLGSPRDRRSPLEDRHPRESLCHRRRRQLRGHFRQRLARYHARTARIPCQADVERHVEEYRLHVASPGAANRQIRPPLLRRQVGGVDVRHGAPDRQTLLQQVAQRLEDPYVNRLDRKSTRLNS